MTVRTRRIMACVAALLVALIAMAPWFDVLHPVLTNATVYLWFGGLGLLEAADRLFPPGPPGQNLNTDERDTYLSLSFTGLGLAIALSLVYCFWERQPTKKALTISYFAFLIVLTSMSFANFAMGDMLLNRKAQVLINVVLVILGLIVVVELLQMRPSTSAGVVVRAVVVFLILLQAVALPGIYGLLWLLNWQGAIRLGQSRDFNPGWISATAAVASAAIATLNYRRSQNALRDTVQREQSRIIAP